jgi:hypothetical protein
MRTGQEACCWWQSGERERVSWAAPPGVLGLDSAPMRSPDAGGPPVPRPSAPGRALATPVRVRTWLRTAARQQQASWSVRTRCELARKLVAGGNPASAGGSPGPRHQGCWGSIPLRCEVQTQAGRRCRGPPHRDVRSQNLPGSGLGSARQRASNKLPGQFGLDAPARFAPRRGRRRARPRAAHRCDRGRAALAQAALDRRRALGPGLRAHLA